MRSRSKSGLISIVPGAQLALAWASPAMPDLVTEPIGRYLLRVNAFLKAFSTP